MTRLLPSLAQLQTQTVLLSGGEPLLNPRMGADCRGCCAPPACQGLAADFGAVPGQARAPAPQSLFDSNHRLHGRDRFGNLCRHPGSGRIRQGVRGNPRRRRSRARARPTGHSAARQLPPIDRHLSIWRGSLGAAQVSFLAVDVANPHAFGRKDGFAAESSPRRGGFDGARSAAACIGARVIPRISVPVSLRRVRRNCGASRNTSPPFADQAAYPPVRCNAPEFSAVIGATGKIQPCFFIPGPPDAQLGDNLGRVLNSQSFMKLRGDIRAGMRAECKTCVCSLWRDLDALHDTTMPAKFVL